MKNFPKIINSSKESEKKIKLLIGKKRNRIHVNLTSEFKKEIHKINMEQKILEARKKMIEEDITRKEKEKELIEKEIKRKEEQKKCIKEKEDKMFKIKKEIDNMEMNYIHELKEFFYLKKSIENPEEDKNSH